MADKKTLAGKAPTQSKREGVALKNQGNTSSRQVKGTKAREKKKVEIPQAGVKDQVWVWRAGGSGTLTLPSTFTVTIPNENGGAKQERIMYSEGAPDILMSELSKYNETPNKTPIRMYNSMLHVPADNPTLQNYLSHLVYYGGYSDIFLDDPEREAIAESELFELIDANKDDIMEMDVVDLRATATALRLGVDIITPKKAVQNKLRKENHNNPEQVSKIIADDAQKIYFIASEILTHRLAELNNGSLIWEDGRSIMAIPDNFMPKDFIGQQLINDKNVRDNWLKTFKEALMDVYPN